MPQTNIFFWMQSTCAIDGWPLDWILSTKISLQLPWKKRIGPFLLINYITWRKMFRPQTKIIFWMQSPCRLKAGLKIEYSAYKSSLNCLENSRIGSLIFDNSITRSEMFMPQTNIFFWMHSPCGIDGWPWDWILRPNFSPQLPWKRPNKAYLR
jgi:hypothetical protein